MLGDRNITTIMRDETGAAILGEVDRQISKTMMHHIVVRAKRQTKRGRECLGSEEASLSCDI